MMEPRIQYARASDGVNIAFWAINSGAPLVCGPMTPFSHVQLEWQIPDCRRWYELLAGERMLVRYDGRGTGLSDRDATDYSLNAAVLDLEAVVDRLALERFVLFGAVDGGMPVIAYAARNPERVSHLILWCTWARRSDVSSVPGAGSLRALIEQDWEIYTETAARVMLGWESEAQARAFAAFYRQCTSQQALLGMLGGIYAMDVTGELPHIHCPTLVLHRRQYRVDVSVARSLAAGVPDARLALLEGSSPVPFMGDVASVLRAVHDFLGDEEIDIHRQPAGPPVAIMFTDMKSSTPITQRLGDAAAQEIVRAHNAAVRRALRSHGGHEVKQTGDGIMASFSSTHSAVECAIAIQRAVAKYVGEHPDAPLAVRIGLNAGEPVAEEGDLYGTAVQLASRICETAAPGQVLVSDVVRALAAGKGIAFVDRGESALKGFDDPARLYEVIW